MSSRSRSAFDPSSPRDAIVLRSRKHQPRLLNAPRAWRRSIVRRPAHQPGEEITALVRGQRRSIVRGHLAVVDLAQEVAPARIDLVVRSQGLFRRRAAGGVASGAARADDRRDVGSKARRRHRTALREIIRATGRRRRRRRRSAGERCDEQREYGSTGRGCKTHRGRGVTPRSRCTYRRNGSGPSSLPASRNGSVRCDRSRVSARW